MALSTGELSSIEGKLVLMSATATRKTIRILTDQFPEVSKWKLLLNLPLRENVTILVPPQDFIPSSFEITLLPFIDRIKKYGETILILVRGKESGIPLLKQGLIQKMLVWYFMKITTNLGGGQFKSQ